MWEAIELRANRGTEHCTCTANSGNATLFMIEASQDMIFSRFSSLSLSFWSFPFLTGRPITGIAQKFLSQLEQFLKTSISLKKNSVGNKKSYRDIAGGRKERESVLYFQSNCGYGLHGRLSSAGSLTGLSGESSSTSIIVVIWTTPDRYSF